MGITTALILRGWYHRNNMQNLLIASWPWPPQPKPSTATSFPLLASAPGLPLATATVPAPLSTEPTATVLARGAPMLPTDMASDTESPFPPLLRTATTSTDMSLPPVTPSASLILVLPDLSSRGLSSTPATARGPLMLLMDTESVTESPFPPLLRPATTCTDMSLPLDTPSASLILVPLALSSRGLSFTPATARGALSLSTEEWLSTLDTPCLPLTGLLRVSALDTATATATAMGSTGTARGPLMPTTELLPLPTL